MAKQFICTSTYPIVETKQGKIRGFVEDGTFKYYGIMCVNGIGIIDNAYKGDNDVWHFPAIGCKGFYDALGLFHAQTSIIHKGDRICQMRIQKCQPEIEFEEVDFLGNADRNGLGSTGKR